VSRYTLGEVMKLIRSNLKEILDQRNISIRQVARDINYRFDSVRSLYNNTLQHYPQPLIDKLCTYLDIGIGDLLEHSKDDHG
jgi:putative transcriptional regulator